MEQPIPSHWGNRKLWQVHCRQEGVARLCPKLLATGGGSLGSVGGTGVILEPGLEELSLQRLSQLPVLSFTLTVLMKYHLGRSGLLSDGGARHGAALLIRAVTSDAHHHPL